MKGTVVLILSAALFLALPDALNAQTPAPKPGADHKKLDVLAGNWAADGNVHAGPFGTEGKFACTDRRAWMPGGFFLEIRRDCKGTAGDDSGLIVIGYDAVRRAHTYSFFWSDGITGTGTLTIGSGSLAWLDSVKTGDGKSFQQRCTEQLGTGSMSTTVKCETSSDGKSWSPSFDGKWTKSR